MIRNDVKVDELLGEKYVVPESIFDGKRTKTTHFMLNTLFPNSSLTATEYFVNTFLGDDEYKHSIVRPLFLLFKANLDEPKWLTIAERLRLKNEYVLEYYVGNSGNKALIMMVFQVNAKFAKDYALFKQGKYSQFSPEYKKLFVRFTHDERAQPVESTIYKVLFKSHELKRDMAAFFTVSSDRPTVFDPEDELWGKPESEYEYYRYKKEKHE